MKNGQVIKSMTAVTEEEMALVNRYARRTLKAEEVYLFSVALCDNDIDRDHERFTIEALFELEKLFVGKTGIVDHDPSAKNQKARIISCHVEAMEGCRTAMGDQLFCLTARAYIVRTPGNRELIEAIDAGIVKEVSVGCSMGRTLCSVCHKDMRSQECRHRKGAEYNGELCYGELCDAQDAYEFSFVAVPAQRNAGVLKSWKQEEKMTEVVKKLNSEQTLSLSQSETEKLRAYVRELEENTECAKAYRSEVGNRLKKCVKEQGLSLGYEMTQRIIDKLNIAEMKALIKALCGSKTTAQLPCNPDQQVQNNHQFTI